MRPAGRLGVAMVAAVTMAGLCAADAAPAYERRCLDCEIPFQWDDGASQPPVVAPYPQGFTALMTIRPGTTRPAPALAPLRRYPEVAAALSACVAATLPPADARWSDLTLRISFRRDGAINGVPVIPHLTASEGPDGAVRARAAMMTALRGCTPLAFSPGLGQAIAGQIFAIRFIQQRTT